MKANEYLALQTKSFERRQALTKKKRQDYADEEDVLANFKRMGKAAQVLRIHKIWETEPALAYSLFMVLMKVDRIVNLTMGSKKPANEAITDTWDDAKNYLDLAEALYTEKT
jgi:hypothetical protein